MKWVAHSTRIFESARPGGIVGGLLAGIIAGIAVFANLQDPANAPRWAYKAPIFALIGGAFVGTMFWGKVFPKDGDK